MECWKAEFRKSGRFDTSGTLVALFVAQTSTSGFFFDREDGSKTKFKVIVGPNENVPHLIVNQESQWHKTVRLLI